MEPSDLSAEEIEAILADLSPEERSAALQLIEEEAQGVHETRERMLESIYENPLPPIDEFVYAKKYLGIPKQALFPAVMDLIVALDDPGVREAFIVAGKGSGKSTFTSITMARAAQRILNYRDPSGYFGVMPGTMIAIVNMSISADQAENVIFNKFWQVLEHSQCFKHGDSATYIKRKRHIEFQKNLHALSGHSGYRAYFGYDVFSATLDECAWYRDTSDHPVSEEIYAGVLGSAKTRFPHDYKIIGITSPQSEDDFAYTRLVDVKTRGRKIVLASGDSDSDMRTKVVTT